MHMATIERARRQRNDGAADAVPCPVSDAPLLEKIGQYRVHGRRTDNTVTELAG
jgi:hypothetical protein